MDRVSRRRPEYKGTYVSLNNQLEKYHGDFYRFTQVLDKFASAPVPVLLEALEWAAFRAHDLATDPPFTPWDGKTVSVGDILQEQAELRKLSLF